MGRLLRVELRRRRGDRARARVPARARDPPLSTQAEIWGSASYERLAETFAPIHDRVVDALEVRPGVHVLDVACGTGAVALRAARRGADVVGIDIAPGQLEKARRAAAAESLDIQFDAEDCQQLPYADESFDAVASVFGLIFAPDHGRAATEGARVCRPGGRLAFTAWPKDEWTLLGERVGRYFPEEVDHWTWAAEDHAQKLLGDAFDLRFETGEWLVTADSPAELWELVSTSAPHLKAWYESLDEERQTEAERAYLEFFADKRLRREYVLILGTRR